MECPCFTLSSLANCLVNYDYLPMRSQIKKDKITKLVVLPLYPQFSISTSGSSICVLQSIIRWITVSYLSLYFVDLSYTLHNHIAGKMFILQDCQFLSSNHGINVKGILTQWLT